MPHHALLKGDVYDECEAEDLSLEKVLRSFRNVFLPMMEKLG
jgi:hypothetical protein